MLLKTTDTLVHPEHDAKRLAYKFLLWLASSHAQYLHHKQFALQEVDTIVGFSHSERLATNPCQFRTLPCPESLQAFRPIKAFPSSFSAPSLLLFMPISASFDAWAFPTPNSRFWKSAMSSFGRPIHLGAASRTAVRTSPRVFAIS